MWRVYEGGDGFLLSALTTTMKVGIVIPDTVKIWQLLVRLHLLVEEPVGLSLF